MVQLFFILTALFLAVNVQGKQCGTSLSETDVWRIVGGQNSVKGAWPWQALLFVKTYWGSPRQICGGSVIDRQWVLTAAHCVDELLQPSQYLVRVGEHNVKVTEGTEMDFNVTKVLTHENFDRKTMDNDVALLKLSHPIDTNNNDNVNTICLPDNANDNIEGQICVTTGWGATRFNGFTQPDILQEVSIPIVRNEDCAEAYIDVNPVTERMVCAGFAHGGKGVCHGDSGGPLVCKKDNRWQLIGVTSWGVGCSKAGYPGVYARVSHFSRWINTMMSAN